MIHKVSVRASEFHSHSKQSQDTVTTPEEDSAEIAKQVIFDVDNEIKSGSSDIIDSDDWGEW